MKRKLSKQERAARKRRRLEFMTLFINGKQERVRRPPTVEGMDVDQFIRENADAMWLHQNEMWDLLKKTKTEIKHDSFPEIKC